MTSSEKTEKEAANAKGFAKVHSAQTLGLDAHIVDVEIDLLRGLHAFSIVGLPDKAVEESRDRVSAAIKNSGYTSPKKHNQKVVVSLAPADIKKEGPAFDLGIALAYLLATEEISFNPNGKLFIGELSLDGKLRSVGGILPLVKHAVSKGFTEIFVPSKNQSEAALIRGAEIYGAETLADVIDHLNSETSITLTPSPPTEVVYERGVSSFDFSDVKGNTSAKRALEIAAAGGHNVALYGPPGTGKTMLARAFTSILPELPFDDVLEVTGVHSVAGTLKETLITHPPFRAPHHTSSYVAMVGGGTFPKPGEVTLAHKGVLFLDEFPEFDRRVLEALRQPLEDRVVSISRAKGSAVFPANFILVAAMNPCPCGNYGSTKECTCSAHRLEQYRRKISGPIIDRIDMWIEVTKVDHEKLSGTHREEEGSDEVQKRVRAARARQADRFSNSAVSLNSDMSARDLSAHVALTEDVKTLLDESAKKLNLSARSYHRLMKLARTIADLEASDDILEAHLLEALQYRPKKLI